MSPVPSSVYPIVPLSKPVFEGEAEQAASAGTAAVDQPAGGLSAVLKPCKLGFRDGCYHIVYRPTGSVVTLQGTLRVDRAAPDGGPDNIIVSGDLYTIPGTLGPVVPVPVGVDAGAIEGAGDAGIPPSVALAASAVEPGDTAATLLRPRIPIFARSRYHSYLKVTSVSAPTSAPIGGCVLTLVAEQFFYTQPPNGQHQGSFPQTASRIVTMKLKKVSAPPPFSLTGGPFFEGTLFVGGADKGTVTLAWVSPFFRRCVVEVDTVAGAVPPAPVPDGSGGTEFFDSIFAKIGWQLTVISDQTNIPIPGGVNPTDCWSSANMHNLMTSVRNPATNLDTEWRIHLLVVPARLGCSRGIMYDQIGVPREACASFSDDGYPSSDSSNFGVAANQMQRNVPRAYLRSATHEITHTLNQIHQEQETSADNSIMTTTPSVADVLGGPGSGAPGVFPDQINLAHNTTVRHHLNHMPDPVIRPGGWPFASWFPSAAPQASDRHLFAESEMELAVSCAPERVALGQPVELTWTLTNKTAAPVLTPSDISLEALYAHMTVTDADGRERQVRPFEIVCDHSKIGVLDPGASVTAGMRVFWSTAGFAFERPGRYRVSVAIDWSVRGIPVSVQGTTDVFVEYPISDADNRAAGLVLHEDVGKWVALGGDAYHLPEAVRRLNLLGGTQTRDLGGTAPRLLQGFAGLLPTGDGTGDGGSRAVRGAAKAAKRSPSRPAARKSASKAAPGRGRRR